MRRQENRPVCVRSPVCHTGRRTGRTVSLKQFFKRNGRRIAVLTCGIYLVHIVAPVYYAKLQAELYMAVSGKVTAKETGQAIEKALVTIIKIQNDLPGEMRTAITNGQGQYIFEMLPPGDYQVIVYPPKGTDFAWDLTNKKKIQVIRGRNVLNVDFQLERGGKISGRIFKADGVTSVPGTSVIAISSGGINAVRTDSFGKFDIKQLKEGTYSIFAIPNGYASTIEKNILASASVIPQLINIKLSPAETTCTSGSVRDSLSNEPIKNALVAIIGEKTQGLSFTDLKGQYKICGLEPGKYKAVAGVVGSELQEKDAIIIVDGQTTITDFNLVRQNQEGTEHNNKGSRKFSLNIMRFFLRNFGVSHAYAQDSGGGWCGDPVPSCFDNCLKELGLGTPLDVLGEMAKCVAPTNIPTALIFALCGIGPTPWAKARIAPAIVLITFFLAGPIAAEIAAIGIQALCAAAYINAYFLCPATIPFECALECG